MCWISTAEKFVPWDHFCPGISSTYSVFFPPCSRHKIRLISPISIQGQYYVKILQCNTWKKTCSDAHKADLLGVKLVFIPFKAPHLLRNRMSLILFESYEVELDHFPLDASHALLWLQNTGADHHCFQLWDHLLIIFHFLAKPAKRKPNSRKQKDLLLFLGLGVDVSEHSDVWKVYPELAQKSGHSEDEGEEKMERRNNTWTSMAKITYW